MKNYRIAVLAGDGIGPEVVEGTRVVLQAVDDLLRQGGSSLDLVDMAMGLEAYENCGHTLPPETLVGAQECDGILMGPIMNHIYAIGEPGVVNPSKVFRKELDLFANIRPVRAYPGIKALYQDVDIVVVRENTEGFYADRNVLDGNGELRPDADTVVSVRVVTRRASERIAQTAFEVARQRGGKRRVSVAHKANVLRKGCGLFLEACRAVAADFPDITLDAFHVDALAMHLVMRPSEFDVIVSTNLFGDVLSDLTAGLVGGLGLAPGLNAGRSLAMAQAVHGSAPDIAGLNIANPIAEILSAALLLRWLAERHGDTALIRIASLIEEAVALTIKEGTGLTPDLGGSGSTLDVAHSVVESIGTLASLSIGA
ncbi:MAG: isocitrate/isopropylmalate dehydrogenase family protein [Truepera sp.]|nr:isocitrate/isopropylmalate dehydrogenase family protein [Truepera sp.]